MSSIQDTLERSWISLRPLLRYFHCFSAKWKSIKSDGREIQFKQVIYVAKIYPRCGWIKDIQGYPNHITPLHQLSIRPSVRQNYLLALQPSAGARKKPPVVGGLNFLVIHILNLIIWY